MTSPRLVISTDNGLGSKSGDIDDGLALLHLLTNVQSVDCVFSIFGNTSEADSLRNTRTLIRALHLTVPVVSGAKSPQHTANPYHGVLNPLAPARMLELGPLTNLSLYLKSVTAANARASIQEVGIVGTTLNTWGRWPPVWPFEYNLSKDFAATRAVFSSDLPLLIFPLDVLRCFRLRLDELRLANDASTRWLRSYVERWFRRSRRLYLRSSVIGWDVVAALYFTHPNAFRVESRWVELTRNMVRYSSKGKEVRVVTRFDANECRQILCESLRRIALHGV